MVPTPPIPKASRWRRTLKRLALAAVVISIPAIALAVWYFSDCAPPDDSDLIVKFQPVPGEENAYIPLAKVDFLPLDFKTYAKAHGRKVDELYLIQRDPSLDPPLVEGFFQQAEATLAGVDAALQRKMFQFPDFTDINQHMEEKDLTPLLNFSETHLHWAQMNSRWDLALLDLRRLFDLASKMHAAQHYFTEGLVANALEEIALRACDDLTADPNTPRRAIDALRALLPDAGSEAAAFKSSLQVDYTRQKLLWNFMSDISQFHRSLQRVGQGEFKSAVLVATTQVNRTLLNFANVSRAMAVWADAPYSIWRRQADDIESWSRWQPFQHRNATGKQVIVSLWIQTPEVRISELLRLKTLSGLTRVAIAARLFWEDHQKLPPTLADLMPQYLEKIPLDPYDGQPLRYDAARGMIWSVGKIIQDLGGGKSASMIINTPAGKTSTTEEEPTLALTFALPAMKK